MPHGAGIMLEGEQDCGFDDPSWEDVETMFGRLDGHHWWSLSIEGPGDERLLISGGRNRKYAVEWTLDWQVHYALVSPGESPNAAFDITGRYGDHPARLCVDAVTALAAARAFYDDGVRLPDAPWERLS